MTPHVKEHVAVHQPGFVKRHVAVAVREVPDVVHRFEFDHRDAPAGILIDDLDPEPGNGSYRRLELQGEEKDADANNDKRS